MPPDAPSEAAIPLTKPFPPGGMATLLFEGMRHDALVRARHLTISASRKGAWDAISIPPGWPRRTFGLPGWDSIGSTPTREVSRLKRDLGHCPAPCA